MHGLCTGCISFLSRDTRRRLWKHRPLDPGFKSRLCLWLAVWLWADVLTLLNFEWRQYLFYKKVWGFIETEISCPLGHHTVVAQEAIFCKAWNIGSRKDPVSILPPLICCMTSGESLDLSDPQFPLEIILQEWLWGSEEKTDCMRNWFVNFSAIYVTITINRMGSRLAQKNLRPLLAHCARGLFWTMGMGVTSKSEARLQKPPRRLASPKSASPALLVAEISFTRK